MKKAVINLFVGAVMSACLSAVCIAASEPVADTTPPVKSNEKKQKKKTFPGQENLIDINSASPEQLKTLPGLTDGEVNKIIAGRPYRAKNQLKQKNIITATQYEGIKKMIVAKTPPKQVE